MEHKKTITTIFIVPTLKINRDKLKANGFINGYVKDAKRDVQYENAAYLLFRPENLDMFKEFLDEEYERTKYIVDDYDYDGGFVVLVYEINPRFNRDITLVKKGKYSKTSKDFQSIFPKVITIIKNSLKREELTLQYRIFNKTEDLRKYWEDRLGVEFTDDMEVWQGFIEENEVLDIEKLKEAHV